MPGVPDRAAANDDTAAAAAISTTPTATAATATAPSATATTATAAAAANVVGNVDRLRPSSEVTPAVAGSRLLLETVCGFRPAGI